MSKNTKETGDIAEACVIAACMKQKWTVLIPFGDNQRYDIVIDRGNGFERCQIKNGRYENGGLVANNYSVYADTHKTVGKRYTEDDFDLFIVYSPYTDKCYLVEWDNLQCAELRLRIDSPKNGQTKGIKWAKDFEIGDMTEPGNVADC